MQEPPDAMAGESRALSDEECSSMGVPPGAFSLLMSKHEIDGAAKDLKNSQFPPAFQLEVVWGFLDGQAGTGPALADATPAGNTGRKATEHKPIPEKKLYAKHCAECRGAGTPPLSFVKFILSLTESQGPATNSSQVSTFSRRLSPTSKTFSKTFKNLRRPSPLNSPLGAIQEAAESISEHSPEAPAIRTSTQALLAHAREQTAQLWAAERHPRYEPETGMCVDRMCSRAFKCVFLLPNVF